MSNYLRREADSFIFRRRVPDRLQRRLGQREIYRSLKTTVRKIAKARAALMFVATEKLFCMVDEIDEEILADEDIRAAVRLWLSSNIWTSKFAHQLDNLTPGVLRERQEKLPDLLLEDWDEDRPISASQNAIMHAWSALENADYEGAGRGETLSKTIAVLREMLKERVDKRLQVVFAPEMLSPTTHPTMPASTASATSLNMSKLSTFTGKWHSDIFKGYNGAKGLSNETTDQYLKTVELFVGLMGDLPLAKITFDIAADFREKLLQLPKSHGKGRTGSIKKELQRAKEKVGGPKLEMKTAKRHFSGMNSIWKWLIYRKHVSAEVNPFSGHSFPGTKSRKTARDAWSSEDLSLLLSSPAYERAPKDSALHWMPLIALHSGLRIEEIGRLRPTLDFITRDGVFCFDIKARDGWDPKTEAGIRVVPVHSWLLKHGLRDLVNSRTSSGAQHLFPELLIQRDKITAGFSRDFSRLKQDLGIGGKTTFHSFRHTFRTVLESTDHRESHIDAVMGHESVGSEGKVYTKGVTTAKLQEVVESFKPSLDLNAIGKGIQLVSTSKAAKPRVAKVKLTPPALDSNGRVIRKGQGLR